MSDPFCKTCGKTFTRKAALEKHEQRKNPCKAPTQLLEATVAAAVARAGVPHLEIPTTEFREVSKSFHVKLSKEQRQEEGIFFTPKKVRDLLFDTLDRLDVKPQRILEPSFGTGEFLLDAKRRFSQAEIVGVEKNTELATSFKCPGVSTENIDFLSWQGTADCIIGNPPYFVLDSKSVEKEEWSQAFTGRPNIYVMFLLKCLKDHLTPDGTLAFILPTSLCNCSYYQPMRDFIQKYTTVRHLEYLDKPGFYETMQPTMLLVLQKKKINDEFLFRAPNQQVYITPFSKELTELTKTAKTLGSLGLSVKTGNVVWNQVKKNLTSDTGTLLIYSSNIKDNTLVLNNLRGDEKKQYVKDLTKPTISGPVLLVERGYGNAFHFNGVLTDLQDFYAENHLNVVYPKTPQAASNLSKVLKSFQDKRTQEFVRLFVGNGMMSASELESLLPVFV